MDTNRVVLLDASGEPERLPLLHKYDVGVAILERLKSHPEVASSGWIEIEEFSPGCYFNFTAVPYM